MSRRQFRDYIAENAKNLPPPPLPEGKALPVPPLAPATDATPPLPVPPVPPPEYGHIPEFRQASSITAAGIRKPPVLIEGLLHQGCKMSLTGEAKSFKSWDLIDLAISISLGLPWWGLRTHRGLVIYLNFELIAAFFDERVLTVCQAKGCTPPEDLHIWHLRGHCYDLAVLAKVLKVRLAALGRPIAAIIVDPVYKALGDLDENSAGDMNQLMMLIENIALPFDAAVVFAHHFAKGNAANKDSKDRGSGSGVLSRDPDTLVSLTRHEEPDCYTVSSNLRYLPRMPEFVVRWEFPLMKMDESLDPRRLWQPGRPAETGAPGTPAETQSVFGEGDVLECLPAQGAMDDLWRKMVALRFGRTGQDYYNCKAKLLAHGVVVKRGQKYYRQNLNLTQT